MPRNVEIKARVDDLATLELRVRELAQERGAGEPEVLHQRDTYFRIPDGRLKLRDFGNGSAELIFYRRPDDAGPKTSIYRKVETDDPAGLRALLTEALELEGEVVKERHLWLLDRTRIHLDRVERLGDFVELEVVLAEDETEATGATEAREVMTTLGISNEDLVAGAYVDLLHGPRADEHSSS